MDAPHPTTDRGHVPDRAILTAAARGAGAGEDLVRQLVEDALEERQAATA